MVEMISFKRCNKTVQSDFSIQWWETTENNSHKIKELDFLGLILQHFSDLVSFFGSEGIHTFPLGRSSSCLENKHAPWSVCPKLAHTSQRPFDRFRCEVVVLEYDMGWCDLQTTGVDYSSLVVNILDFVEFWSICRTDHRWGWCWR